MSTIDTFETLPYRATLTAIAHQLRQFGGLAWLTSSGRRGGRYDILTAAPHTSVRYQDGVLQIGAERVLTRQPLKVLEQRNPAISAPRQAPPFRSGFVGYLGYPLHTTCERQISPPADPTQMPELAGGLYSWALVADHRTRTLALVGEKPPPLEILTAIHSSVQSGEPGYVLTGEFTSTFSEQCYKQAFKQLKEHILAGDCYQTNLARHFVAPCTGDPIALLADFQRLQGASYGALLEFDEGCVLSVSPERFAYGRDGRISTWPIKGTRPRGISLADDHQFAAALASSAKDRAENLMIVDLLRNDLGRVCETGSVTVDALCHVTTHSNVHHLQSVVSGQLRNEIGPWGALERLFPCGSITGAPKIKAIDIINELEPVGRSAYCGAIGYIDDTNGQFDFSVAIRTAVLSNKELHVWGGGGIVADSTADEELAEIDAKVGRLLRGLNQIR